MKGNVLFDKDYLKSLGIVAISGGKIPYREPPAGWEKLKLIKEWYEPEERTMEAPDTIKVKLVTERGAWTTTREGTLQQVMRKLIEEEDMNDLLQDTKRLELSRA